MIAGDLHRPPPHLVVKVWFYSLGTASRSLIQSLGIVEPVPVTPLMDSGSWIDREESERNDLFV